MGIFHAEAAKAGLFTIYRAEIDMRGKIMGGVPKDPKVVEGWLKSKAGIKDEWELYQAVLRTMIEQGVDISEGASHEEVLAAYDNWSKEHALAKQTNGFKIDSAHGLYVEARQVKAGIKENVNILFAGERWGRTNKGPKNFTAERIFVVPDKIFLGRTMPDGVDLSIGHVNGPSGPQSSLTYVEYVQNPTLHFYVASLRDELAEEHWPLIWEAFQLNGLGALRSQGAGQFDIWAWEDVSADPEVQNLVSRKERLGEPQLAGALSTANVSANGGGATATATS